MAKKQKYKFEFSPNLLILLGEQLIQDKKIALSELVKNSYDADASFVKVIVNPQSITILDDGIGMDIDIIEKVWLRPGVSSKGDFVKEKRLTKKYKRSPIGEKGVGRLGSHKLGNIIELYTKKENSEEVYLKIDWREFNNNDRIEDIPLEVKINKIPKVFTKNNSGTKIIINDLKEEWNDKDINALESDLSGLVSPFSDIEDFTILLNNSNELFDRDLKTQTKFNLDSALFYFNIEMFNGTIIKFEYKFLPWKGFEKVSPRIISLSNEKNLIEKILNKNNNILSLKLNNDNNCKIGKIKFEGYIYDFDNLLWRQQRQFSNQEKKQIKDYVNNNGGVRVYRDNFRVFNYGEKGNDLLELDIKRARKYSEMISSQRIISSVILDRQESLDLIEKTNREGFVHNKAFSIFKNQLEEVINIVSFLRLDDRDKLKRLSMKEEDKAGIEKKIETIKSIINKSELNEDEKDKLNKQFDSFSDEFSQIKSIFLNATQVGISLSHVIHELDKIIVNVETQIRRENWKEATEIFKYLAETVNAYKETIKLDKKQAKIVVKEIIDKAIFNSKARFVFHKVDVNVNCSDNIFIVAKQNLIIGVINNLFDNSLYWLEYQKIKNKRIFINCYVEDNEVNIVVADNGKGFTISFESALSAFISGRKDDSSMGIGLHLANQVMEAHQGRIVKGDFEKENLPDDFKEGAIVKLIFKNE